MIKLLFWPVLVPSFLFAAALGAITPLIILAAIDIGISPAAAALLMAASGVAALTCTVPVGAAIDRVGDKRAMTLATLNAAGALALTILALAVPSGWSIALYMAGHLLRVPAQVAWGLARQAVVAETVAAKDRGKAMTSLGGAQRAGFLAGPLAGSLMLIWLPLWTVFAFSIILVLAATVLLRIPRFNSTFDRATAQARENRAAAETSQLSVAWNTVFIAGIGVSLLSVARVSQPILVALWGLHLGWSEAQISLAIALGSALEIVLMFPGGYLKDRVGRSFILSLCLVFFGGGFLLVPFWDGSWGFVFALICMSVGNGLGSGINMTIGADLSPDTGRAKFLSIWSMFSQVAVVGGPLGISAVLTAFALPAAFILVGSLTVFGAVWALTTQPITKLPTGSRRS